MSHRWLLFAVGLALLASAVLLAPTPPAEQTSTLTALGRSMGGLRVGLVDLLFLRAERLRREGRADEVPGLYRAVLELDPDNTTAVDHLVAVYAYDLRIESNDPEERFAWWRRAKDLLDRGLSRHPDDPSLHMRMSDLLLEIPLTDEILEAAVFRAVPSAHAEAIRHLFEAARLTPTLPRRGRAHLLRLALFLPVWALEAQDAGEGAVATSLLTRGEALLDLRQDVYREMTFPLGPPDPETGEASISSVHDVLAEGLEAVRMRGLARAGGSQTAAEAAAEAFGLRHPGAPLAPRLR